jgi:replication factor A1
LKYKIDSSEFFDCIIQSWNKEKAECRQLSIMCRQKTEDSAIFCFTDDQGVIAQFPIPVTILQGKNPLEGYVRLISPMTVKKVAIKDLKAGMRRIDLIAKVLEISEPNIVYTKYGTEAYISNALIGDETGIIRMSLWNKQIGMISKGDTIKIENGIVTSFRGELQLKIRRNGSLNPI